MIPDRAEIVASFVGAWRLFRLDPSAMACFNTSLDGFWRSFFGAVLSLPAFAFSFAFLIADLEDPPEPAVAFILGIMAYGISWVAFPVIAAFVVRPMGLGHRYVPYIVAHNWGATLVAQAYFLAEILIRIGLFAGDLSDFVKLILFAVTLWYGWRVARVALEASISIALAMVVLATGLDLLISYALYAAL